jgi:cytosine/adenosine deaminase-related metal-dependent hydrolase
MSTPARGYRARWVVPVSAPPLEHGTVVVTGGVITWVGPADEAPAGVMMHDLGDVVLLPGLVNAHCHLELTAMRGFLEALEFRRWILRLTAGKRAVLDQAALLDAARYGIEEGLRAGITTYADTSDSGVGFEAMLEYGVRGIMYQEVFGPDPAQCDAALAILSAQIEARRPQQTSLVQLGVSPHAPYTVSDALFVGAAALARQHGLPVAIHLAESDEEQRLVVEGAGPFADGLRARGIAVAPRGRTPVALLHGLGVLAPGVLLIHCVRVDGQDVDAIAGTGCAVAHCPISNARLGHGIAPLAELLQAGVSVGLGSDSVASNNRMDLLQEARQASLMQRARLQSHTAIGGDDALSLATLGGAAALGLDMRIGSLDVGKDADLAAFPLRGLLPVQDPSDAAVFALAGTPAQFVAVRGQVLVEQGQLLHQRPGLEARVQQTADQLRDWLAEGGELRPLPAAGVR